MCGITRFLLDGPSDWRQYAPELAAIIRGRRQANGAGIMAWTLVMLNGLLSYHILTKSFKAHD